MGNYTEFRDGYLRETTFGTSLITTAGDTTYLWGAISQEAVHPSPRTTINYRATGLNAQEVPAGELWKGVFDLSGMYAVGMQNGVLFEAVLGKSSTTDDSPGAGFNTHVITPPDDGSLLSSFTIHHERTGTGTDWATQFLGCKIANLTITCGFEQKYLIGRVDWIAKKAEDPNLDGTNAMLTNDPALPATANTAPYSWNILTRTFDGNDIDGLTYLELSINPDLMANFVHKWDSGTYVGRWADSFIEGSRKRYELTMQYHPDSDDLWDELVATGNTKDIVFKWARHATNDLIEITLSDVQLVHHEVKSPTPGDTLIEEVVCEPRAVSVSVVDKLEGSDYGE